MSCDASVVLSALQAKASETTDPDELGEALVSSLAEAFAQANWVGIYWLRGEDLVLGPYAGAPTEHERIPTGAGVCGTALATGEDQIVGDVREVENYLACSEHTRSEIVVLIKSMGRVIGEIDMDSDAVGAFDTVDHCILRAVADSFGGLVQEEGEDGEPSPDEEAAES
ncbi:MAG: GAF domain-containing protein [Planctomycetota bacterium]|jgi:GAF domain-containing protein